MLPPFVENFRDAFRRTMSHLDHELHLFNVLTLSRAQNMMKDADANYLRHTTDSMTSRVYRSISWADLMKEALPTQEGPS